MQSYSLVILLACVCYGQAFFDSVFGTSQIWNGLRSGFGINPLSKKVFAGMPRTVDEAVKADWVPDKTVLCGTSSSYEGNRYIGKDGDTGVMLLFDKNGYIAGIQAGIPKNSDPSKYPNPNNRIHHVFNEESKMMVTTAYFVEPSTICSTGRSKASWEKDGTGNMLAFQVGPTSKSLLRIPMEEKDVTAQTNYVDGNCFYTMGKHFWYRHNQAIMSDVDQPCDETFPGFLLYNKGKLTAFGWAFNPHINNSWRWEHPQIAELASVMAGIPKCLSENGPTTTSLHIYMTNNPLANLC